MSFDEVVLPRWTSPSGAGRCGASFGRSVHELRILLWPCSRCPPSLAERGKLKSSRSRRAAVLRQGGLDDPRAVGSSGERSGLGSGCSCPPARFVDLAMPLLPGFIDAIPRVNRVPQGREDGDQIASGTDSG